MMTDLAHYHTPYMLFYRGENVTDYLNRFGFVLYC